MVIPKTNFGLPGQMLQRRRTQRAKRTTSFPLNSNQPATAQTAQGASGGTMAPPAREGKVTLKSFFNKYKNNWVLIASFVFNILFLGCWIKSPEKFLQQ
jgi:hypothetical protein